jgi:signal transduction histidine kinase
LKPELLPLKPLITKLVEHKKRELNDRDIDFVLVVNGGSVLADVNGLTQSLNNYLDNAIKFTQKSNRPRIEVGAKDIHHKCVLWVKDNGIGFDPKFNERIFDIFQRLNQPEDYPGTGIGLAIVRKAMERIGGRAWAVGSPGEGATFYLELPHQEGPVDEQLN